MTDLDRIVQTLRAFVNSEDGDEVFLVVQDISDAADDLERLAAENKRYREALEDISSLRHHSTNAGDYFADVAWFALTSALQPAQENEQ